MHVTEWIFRGAGMIVAVVLLIWFVMPAFIDVWNVGNVVGIICCVWLFVISCKPLQHAVKGLCSHGFALGMYRAVNGVFIAFLAYGLIVTCVMILAANAQPEPGATALVLGAHVHKSGSPSAIISSYREFLKIPVRQQADDDKNGNFRQKSRKYGIVDGKMIVINYCRRSAGELNIREFEQLTPIQVIVVIDQPKNKIQAIWQKEN